MQSSAARVTIGISFMPTPLFWFKFTHFDENIIVLLNNMLFVNKQTNNGFNFVLNLNLHFTHTHAYYFE